MNRDLFFLMERTYWDHPYDDRIRRSFHAARRMKRKDHQNLVPIEEAKPTMD